MNECVCIYEVCVFIKYRIYIYIRKKKIYNSNNGRFNDQFYHLKP